jgi:hypothetical protein
MPFVVSIVDLFSSGHVLPSKLLPGEWRVRQTMRFNGGTKKGNLNL